MFYNLNSTDGTMNLIWDGVKCMIPLLKTRINLNEISITPEVIPYIVLSLFKELYPFYKLAMLNLQ